MKKSVLIYRYKYLPITETFIYEQIVHLKRYKPIVMTSVPPFNLDIFPLSSLYRVRSQQDVISILRKTEIKCIHARFGSGGIRILPIKKKLNVPLLTSFHGSDLSKQLKNQCYRAALPTLFQLSNKITVVSSKMKKRLIQLRCPEEKIELVKSGIDLSKFPFDFDSIVSKNNFSVEGTIRILTVGRLVEKKGTKFLLKAFSLILKRYPAAKLIIIGEGEKKESLQQLAKELRIQDRVEWKGALPQKEVIEEIKKSHVFVLPSITGKDGDQEGIPNVLMEAMAIGRPVISTYHAGIPELVIHGKTGFLVPEKNVKDLTNMIIAVLESSSAWMPLLIRARKYVEQEHDIQKQVYKLEAIYDQLTEGGT